MGSFRQEYRSGLPFSSLGDLPNPEIERVSPALQVDSLPAEPLRCNCREQLLRPGLRNIDILKIILHYWLNIGDGRDRKSRVLLGLSAI